MCFGSTCLVALHWLEEVSLCLLCCFKSFLYCLSLWRPCFIKEIERLENIQLCAAKCILCDYSYKYKFHWLVLKLNSSSKLLHQLQHLLFLGNYLKEQPDNFDTFEYVYFVLSHTRSSCAYKIKVNCCRKLTTLHF